VNPTPELEKRLGALEARLDYLLPLEGRLRELDSKIAELKPKERDIWDKVQILGPYLSGLLVLAVGYWINDSVTHALEREKLDLQYAEQIRNLVQEFDKANTLPAAEANAIGLAMFGRYAIPPLVQRLNAGDVASTAAETGLRMIGANFSADACPRFAGILRDHARLYPWLTHLAMVRVMGQSHCTRQLQVLQQYSTALSHVTADPSSLAAFAARYSTPKDFDFGSVQTLQSELKGAVDILTAEATE
jgi:hypothetical protein